MNDNQYLSNLISRLFFRNPAATVLVLRPHLHRLRHRQLAGHLRRGYIQEHAGTPSQVANQS